MPRRRSQTVKNGLRRVDVADGGDITDPELIITALRLLVASGWNNRVSSVYIQ
jgi:hypothetical protein